MEKSFFENMDNKSLFRYCKYVLSKINFESYSNIVEFFEYVLYDDKLQNLLRAPLGRNLKTIDMEYLYYVLVNNDHVLENGLSDENLKRPSMKTYECEYESHEDVRVIYTYTKNLDSYLDPYDFDGEYLTVLGNNNEIYGYEWNYNRREEVDSEPYQEEYHVIKRISSNSK